MGEPEFRIDWDPQTEKPAGWQRCEAKIRKLLRAYADPNGYRGAPFHVRIAKKDGGWQCTNVWSNNISCPSNCEKPVRLALKMCRLAP
jgi:hypothetical protein